MPEQTLVRLYDVLRHALELLELIENFIPRNTSIFGKVSKVIGEIKTVIN
jgi:hypothetical protein